MFPIAFDFPSLLSVALITIAVLGGSLFIAGQALRIAAMVERRRKNRMMRAAATSEDLRE